MVRSEIGLEQDAGVLDASLGQGRLKHTRRRVHDGNRVANERQRRADVLEGLGIAGRDGEVTRLPSRGGTQSRQVNRQSLLQIPRSARGDQRRARRTAADVNQEARTIRLRTRAGEGCGSGSRTGRPADGRHDDHSPLGGHFETGLA